MDLHLVGTWGQSTKSSFSQHSGPSKWSNKPDVPRASAQFFIFIEQHLVPRSKTNGWLCGHGSLAVKNPRSYNFYISECDHSPAPVNLWNWGPKVVPSICTASSNANIGVYDWKTKRKTKWKNIFSIIEERSLWKIIFLFLSTSLLLKKKAGPQAFKNVWGSTP